eukprot:COSAG06_NODE_12225_length_1407_cov_22.807339_1_plen_469_part_11
MDAYDGDEVVSGCMALFTLGCRHGLALCDAVEMLKVGCDVFVKWIESVSAGGNDYAAGAASCILYFLCAFELIPKMPPETRALAEKPFNDSISRAVGRIKDVLTEQRVCQIYTGSMKAGILSHDDLSLACGWNGVVHCCGYIHPGAFATASEVGMFSAALALYRRVEPLPLSGEWWVSTCDVVDVTSARLTNLSFALADAKYVPSATQAPWWSELLDHGIRLTKLNASACLSERDTMNYVVFTTSLSVVAEAARDESQHEMLIESGVADALEYGILHDFACNAESIAARASGAAVALMGRNEGGKVLRREAVHAVLGRLYHHFDPSTWGFTTPVKTVVPHLSRVSIMVLSDANKKHMLQFEPLIDMLLECLIIDDGNRRKGQDGADMLQEASAGVLHELSLYGPGAVALRSHGSAVSTLHKLCDVGTKVSKERGAAALFELEEEKRPTKAATDDGTGTGLSSTKGKPPP